MDNKPNLPEPPATEEPPLQQTPDMANQQPPKIPEPESIPPERPAEEPPKKKKTWLIVLIIVAGVVVLSMIGGIIYWVAVLNTINDAIDEQAEITQMLNEQQIASVDELMEAYSAKSELNCSYAITMQDGTYDVSEQANAGWQAHKVITIGTDTMTTTLALSGDAVYSWGYTSGNEEYAIKMPWDKISELQDSALSNRFNTEQSIKEAKDSIGGLVCYAIDINADYSVPAKEWADASAMLNVLTNSSIEALINEYGY